MIRQVQSYFPASQSLYFQLPVQQPSQQQVRFGLKGAALKHHSAYQRRLVMEQDVILGMFGSLHPTDKLVNEVADVVLKDSLNDPRALVITNITDFFSDFDYTEGSKDFEKVHNFQSELFDRAWQKIKEARYPDARPQDFILHRFDMIDGQRSELYPRPGEMSTRETKIKYPFDRTPHLSADDIMYAFSFGPVKNIEGGNFRLVDFMQYMKDQNLRFRDLFFDEASQYKFGYFMRNRWIGKNLQPYSVEIKTYANEGEKPIVPIVFVNNEKMAQFHLPTNPHSEQFENRVHQFNIYRTTVKPYRGSPYWQKKAPYPLHTTWLYTNVHSGEQNGR